MIQLSTAIWICVGFIVYYSVFQIFSDFVRSGMAHNTPNLTIAELRTKYHVTIKTFQKNNNLMGFAWIKTIWINENLFKYKKQLMFTFFHEYFHLKHNHKAWILTMRFTLSLLTLLLTIIYWWLFIPIFLGIALLIEHISNIFEDKANDYAKEKTQSHN